MTSKYEDGIEEIFYFVEDENLRKHLADALRASGELTAIASQYPEPMRSACYKSSIINIGSIIEALLHKCFIEKIGEYYIKPEWEYRNIKVLHTVEVENEEENEFESEIIAGKRIKKKKTTASFIDFQKLNKLCESKGIIDKTLFKEIEDARELRNKIHIMRLAANDRKFTKKTVDKISKTAEKVIDIAEDIFKSR